MRWARAGMLGLGERMDPDSRMLGMKVDGEAIGRSVTH